jgi:hypothetical protein
MVRKHNRVADALDCAATPRWRATVFGCALAFAVCHLLAVATDSQAAGLKASLPLEVAHFAAVLCRFLVPFGILLAGIAASCASRWRKSASDIGPQSL